MASETRPKVHALCGLVGAGKTTLARRLAEQLPALRLSRDEWMLRLYGWPYDDPRYVEALPACTQLLWDVALQALGLGVSVVLDWNHWSRDLRADALARAEAAGYDLVVDYLDVPLEAAVARATARATAATAGAHLIDAAGVRHSANFLEPPSDSEGFEVTRHAETRA